MAAVGVPTMSKQTFITTERVWYSVWNGMVGRDGEAIDIVIVHEESKSWRKTNSIGQVWMVANGAI